MSSPDIAMQDRDTQGQRDADNEQTAQDQRATQEQDRAEEARTAANLRSDEQAIMFKLRIGETDAETDAFVARVGRAQLAAYLRKPQLSQLPGMMASWGQEWLSHLRGRWVSLTEWYDFVGSDEVFPSWAWLLIAQLEYDGYAGDSDSLREIRLDIDEAMDAMDLVQPHAVVTEAVRKQVRGVLGGRRRWLFDEQRLETGEERSARVAERRARQAAAREARAAQRQGDGRSGTAAH